MFSPESKQGQRGDEGTPFRVKRINCVVRKRILLTGCTAAAPTSPRANVNDSGDFELLYIAVYSKLGDLPVRTGPASLLYRPVSYHPKNDLARSRAGGRWVLMAMQATWRDDISRGTRHEYGEGCSSKPLQRKAEAVLRGLHFLC